MRALESKELAMIDLGDNRLNVRCRELLKKFNSSPSSSINGSFNGYAESKAAYRFFDNPKVTHDKILLPHIKATIDRLSSYKVILCPQDTSIINYSHRKASVKGLGKLQNNKDQGFLMHPTIAVTEEGLCLGVLSNKIWAREILHGKKVRRKVMPIEDKESLRWVESYRMTNDIATMYPDKMVINITDREGDFYELLQEYKPSISKAHLLIRAKSDRVLAKSEDLQEEKKLWGRVRQQPVSGTIKFNMSAISSPSKKARKGREVVQEIRTCRIKLDPPKKRKYLSKLHSIEVTAILCSEINSLEGEKPIEWLLLTTIQLNENISVIDIVKYYTLRWQIEIFFKTLKSGCTIEEIQLENLDRITNCIALYMIVAWRILFLSLIGRTCPDLPCNMFYKESEWKSVYIIANKKEPPTIIPGIDVINKTIASFGGFLGRKSDGNPGIKSMWIGLQRMRDFAIAFEVFHSETYG